MFKVETDWCHIFETDTSIWS